MRKFITLTVCLIMVATTAMAQYTKGDTVQVNYNGLNIEDYTVMYLYREPDKHLFEDRKWWDNLSVDVYWAPEYMWNPGMYNMSWYQAGVALTKRIMKGNSLRVAFGYDAPYYNLPAHVKGIDDQKLRDMEHENMDRYKLSVDYLWNLTNLYYGYDREDIFNISLALGMVGGFTTHTGGRFVNEYEQDYIFLNNKYRNYTIGQNGKVIGFGIGVQARKHVSPNFSFFIEPRYNIVSDTYDGGKNKYGWDIFPSLYTGFGYHITGQNRLIETGNENAGFMDNVFFAISPGITVVPDPKGVCVPRNEDNPSGYSSELTPGPGLNINLSAGKWINRALAMRYDLYTEIYRHAIETYPKKSWFGSRFTTHIGLRGLGEFDLMYGLMSRHALGRFGLDLLAGLDMGYMNKRQGSFSNALYGIGDVESNSDFYIGPVVGLQGKYYLNRNMALFLEPRFTYDKYYWEQGGGNEWKGEKIYDLNFGIEFYNTRWDRYTTHNVEIDSTLQLHRSKWRLEIGNGFVLPINGGEDYYDYSVQHSVAAAYQFNPIHSGKVRADFQFIHNNYTKSHNTVTQKSRIMVAFDYMANLTNLWMGVDSLRTIQLQGIAGPVLHRIQHTEGNDGWPTVGAELGFNISARIAPQWDLFVEPRYEILWGNTHWTANAGLAYAFNQKDYQTSLFRKFVKETDYIQALGGWQNYTIDARLTESYYEAHKPVQRGLWDINMGRWMEGGFWAIQGGLFYHNNNLYNRSVVYDQLTKYFGARLEAIYNVLHFHQRKHEIPTPLRWTVGAGVEGGYMHKLHENFGFSFTSQLQYHLIDQYGLVAQCRLPLITQNKSNMMVPVDFGFGVQYGGWGDIAEARKQINKYRPERARGYVQVLAGGQLWAVESRARQAGKVEGETYRLRKYEQFGQFDVTYGHLFGNGSFGAQVSGFGAKYGLYDKVNVSDWETNYFGGRVEGVLDPLYVAQVNRGSNRLFQWWLTAGVECGQLKNVRFNTGLTASTQLQVRIWDELRAVASVRTTMLHVNNKANEEVTMMPLIFQGGLMYTLPK